MGVANVPFLIDPAFTDADWSQDFSFYAEDEDHPENWLGDGGEVAFTRRDGVPGDNFTVSTADGTLILDDGNVWQIRSPEADQADITPGIYDGELRRFGSSGVVEALLTFSVPIQAGRSTGDAGFTTCSSSLSGGLKIYRAANALKIVRTGGSVGPHAPQEMGVTVNDRPLPAQPGDTYGEMILRYRAPENRTWDESKCVLDADDATTNQTVWTITVDYTVVGTITIPAGQALGVWDWPDPRLQAGEVLRIYAAATQDPTFGNATLLIKE